MMYGSWGREKYGAKPIKVDALEVGQPLLIRLWEIEIEWPAFRQSSHGVLCCQVWTQRVVAVYQFQAT